MQQKVLEDPFQDMDPQVEEEEEDTDLLDLVACVGGGDNCCSLDT